jgi:hypothetical protein
MIKCILPDKGGTPFTVFARQKAMEYATLHNTTTTSVSVVDLKRRQHIGPLRITASVFILLTALISAYFIDSVTFIRESYSERKHDHISDRRLRPERFY